jgi:hypothetical protein
MAAFAQPTSMGFQDPEQLALQRKLLEAEALRKGGMSDSMGEGYRGGRVFIVGNPLGNIAKSIGGAYLGDKAEQAHNALIGQRNAEEDAFLAARPSETMAQTSPIQGPTQPGEAPLGDVTTQVPKPYQQLAQETRDWTAKAPRYSPLGGALRQAGMMQAVNAPEKLFEREEAAKIRTESERVRLAAARELAREKAEAVERENLRALEGRKELTRLAAALRPAREPKTQIIDTVDDKGNPIKKVVELKVGDSYSALPKSAGKASAAEEKRRLAREDLSSKLTNARALLEANPDAVGLKTMIPDIALQRMSNSGERMTRAALAEMAAEKAHALYGAAFTAAEQRRANQFLPAAGDSYDALIDKIANMEKILAETDGAPAGGAPAGQSPEDVQALIWATKPENLQDPRAIKIRNSLGK